MRAYKEKEFKELELSKVYCNQCGKELLVEEGILKEGCFSVDYEFDPEDVKEGTYDITFSTMGRELKIHTTDYAEEGAKVGLKFGPEDIHVMSKMGVVG